MGDKTVDVPRDTGCSGMVAKRDLVSDDQCTGESSGCAMLLIDNTVREVPIAEISVDTPYFSGQVRSPVPP